MKVYYYAVAGLITNGQRQCLGLPTVVYNCPGKKVRQEGVSEKARAPRGGRTLVVDQRTWKSW